MEPVDAIATHVEELFHSAHTLLGDTRLAERAVHDTCRRAAECLTDAATTPVGRSWIFGLLLEEVRRSLRPSARSGADELIDALRSLAVEDAEVLTLIDIQGFRYQEGADALGITRDELISRLITARRQFRLAANPARSAPPHAFFAAPARVG